jgi:hypothetical protein
MGPNRAQEIGAELTELITLQCNALGAFRNLTPEDAREFAIRRQKIIMLMAELDLLAAISAKDA